MLDQQPWHGQAQYRDERLQDWYYEGGKIVEGTSGETAAMRGGTTKEYRQLKLVTVDEAGHMAPLNQPEAVGAMVWGWIQSHGNNI